MALFNLGGSHRGMSPITMALIGLLAYRTMHGKGRLADMLGMNTAGRPDGTAPAEAPDTSGGLGGILPGGLRGMLGGILGGGALSGGLQDLLNQFRNTGQGGKAESWVSTGPNKPVSAQELEQALGDERIDWLTKQTGLSRQELLSGLSRELPKAVDTLTPHGRIPTEQESAALLSGS